MKPLVIYHADCTDGFGAAFAAWLVLGDEAEYLPIHHGEVKTPEDFDRKVSLAAKNNDVYILDFSFPREVMNALFKNANRVSWLDHHKTAFEMWYPEWVLYNETASCFEDTFSPGGKHYIKLDNTKSGALLAWEYFHPDTEAPMLIKHIDDRDRWQFMIEGTEELHAVLASLKPWRFSQWDHILAETSYRANDGTGIDAFYKEGEAILRAHTQQVQSMLNQARKCRLLKAVPKPGGEHWEALFPVDATGLACNAPSFLASDLGHELANRSGTFGLVWHFTVDKKVRCSLRSNGDYDVSAIAKAFGGGGHKNAAGFEADLYDIMSWTK
jgi:uncharacterized protein